MGVVQEAYNLLTWCTYLVCTHLVHNEIKKVFLLLLMVSEFRRRFATVISPTKFNSDAACLWHYVVVVVVCLLFLFFGVLCVCLFVSFRTMQSQRYYSFHYKLNWPYSQLEFVQHSFRFKILHSNLHNFKSMFSETTPTHLQFYFSAVQRLQNLVKYFFNLRVDFIANLKIKIVFG